MNLKELYVIHYQYKIEMKLLGNPHPAHAGWGLNVKSQLLSKSRTASFNLPQVRGTS